MKAINQFFRNSMPSNKFLDFSLKCKLFFFKQAWSNRDLSCGGYCHDHLFLSPHYLVQDIPCPLITKDKMDSILCKQTLIFSHNVTHCYSNNDNTAYRIFLDCFDIFGDLLAVTLVVHVSLISKRSLLCLQFLFPLSRLL